MNILTDRSLPTPRVAAHSFTEVEWTLVLEHLADVIGDDAWRYTKVPAAKLTTAIAYLAGSEDPDRFAVSNMLTFHGMTKARALFNHRAADNTDVFRRLATFHFGTLADATVVQQGLTLLALISLSDHESDLEDDQKAGKYNPVAAGQWDPKALRTDLKLTLARTPELKAAFDKVVGLDLETVLFWST